MGEYLELSTCVSFFFVEFQLVINQRARYHPAERAYLSILAVGLWP